MKEKRLVQKYFDEISRDTGKFCYGIDDTLKALELGAVETLIIWENLDVIRYSFCNAAGGRRPAPMIYSMAHLFSRRSYRMYS